MSTVLAVAPQVPDLSHVETWVFDLDNTLYNPARCDLFPQMDARMVRFIADLLGCDDLAANEHRAKYFHTYGTTLRGLMDMHDVLPEKFLAYVHELDLSMMEADARLAAGLDALPGRKVIFTNATERHALNVLEKLGIADRFEGIFDVAAAGYIPKPQTAAYDTFLRRYAVKAAGAVMFEDTAKNLLPAATLGMTTVWVRTDRPHGQPEPGDTHIHHTVDELAEWIVAVGEALTARR